MLDLLPEDCFALVLSFASAREACRLSTVSTMMRSMADSNAVWERFLPFDCDQLLCRLDSPVVYSTRKELFLTLCCSPHLMDGGKKMFYIDKETSKKCYVISARELQIQWSDNPLYWSWNTQPYLKSRFAEVAELRTIWWLEIRGKISTKLLSLNTLYFAYIVVKFADRAYGLDTHPSQVSVHLQNWSFQSTVYLHKNGGFKNRVTGIGDGGGGGGEDGWVEIELGKFYVDELGEWEVEMCLKEVETQHLRGGLVVEAIELRPN